MEDADGVGTATDAGGDRIGQPTGERLHLGASLQTDDALQIAHHHRERMRTRRGAEAIVGGVSIGDPVAQRLIDRILEGLGTGPHGDHLGAEQPHTGHVQRLAGGVDRTHIDHAIEAEQCTRGRRGDAVLTGAGLRDDAGLAHALGEQRLAEHVIDLVRTGVVQILTLEDDARATGVLGEPPTFEDRRRAAGVVALQPVQFVEEGGIEATLLIFRGDLLDHRHQRLRHMPAAVDAEVAARIRLVLAALMDAVRCLGQYCHLCHRPRRAGFGQDGWVPAVTSSETAARGSPLVTSPSPTSTASAPAPA